MVLRLHLCFFLRAMPDTNGAVVEPALAGHRPRAANW